jgi:hypothetical protein
VIPCCRVVSLFSFEPAEISDLLRPRCMQGTAEGQPECLWRSTPPRSPFHASLIRPLPSFTPMSMALGPRAIAESDTGNFDMLVSVGHSAMHSERNGNAAAFRKTKQVSTPYLRKDRAKILRDWYEANLDKPYPSPEEKRMLQAKSVAYHPSSRWGTHTHNESAHTESRLSRSLVLLPPSTGPDEIIVMRCGMVKPFELAGCIGRANPKLVSQCTPKKCWWP